MARLVVKSKLYKDIFPRKQFHLVLNIQKPYSIQ